MAKSSAGPAFQCAECGWRTTKWSGRCGECQAWGTVEQIAVSRAGRAAGFSAPPPWPGWAGWMPWAWGTAAWTARAWVALAWAALA